MAFNLYPNGSGGLTGDEIAVNKPLILGTTGHVWYVSSLTGVDAASPKGREREKPLATLNQAVTNAIAGDVIILMESHAETISAQITSAKALTIVSEGLGSSRARLTCGAVGGGAFMISLGAIGSSLNNIYFPASTGATGGRVQFNTSGLVSDNCYFECGVNDATSTISIQAGANSCQLTRAYFLATASQPGPAVSTGATSGFFFEGCTLDGGSFGFNGFAFNAAGILTAVYANDISQLNNADVSLTAGWTGVWNVGEKSGSARFEG